MKQQDMNNEKLSPPELAHAWYEYREYNPRTCTREAAIALNVSEAELVATNCNANVIRLAANWRQVINDLRLLGPVKALTRNAYATHEQTGHYQNLQFTNNNIQVKSKNIDLHLNLNHWHCGFAVKERTPKGSQHSLRFFDSDGSAIHEVYITEKSYLSAYHSLVRSYRSSDQNQEQTILSPAQVTSSNKDSINLEKLRERWRKLKQSHDFDDLLIDVGISHYQALELAGNEFASRVSPDLFCDFMQTLADSEIPIQLLVKNKGAIQAHTGIIHNIRNTGSWFNILDTDFNLRLNKKAIASLWVVRKLMKKGQATSLELYDTEKNIIALIQSSSQLNIEAWNDIVTSLPGLAVVT